MFCPECGTEYREGFTLCADCDVALVEQPPERPGGGHEARPWFPSMPKNVEGDEIEVGGERLVCHHCGFTRFQERRAQLNTAFLTFLKLDWLNRSAVVFACVRCGFLHWFLLDLAEGYVEQDEDRAGEPAECLLCHAPLPAGATRCELCGWSYR